MRVTRSTLVGFALACGVTAVAAQPAPQVPKVDIVQVVGCLKMQAPDNWMLVSASEATPSIANAPAKKDIPTTFTPGKLQYKLIGVGEYDLASHKDRAVLVKGLLIKATPASRLNITSVVPVADSCAAAAK